MEVIYLYLFILVGGLEHESYFFHSVGHHNSKGLSYFSEGLQPPTRFYQQHDQTWDQ